MIRMDDITPDMDWDKFGRIKDIFEKYKIYPLLGVVPDNQDAKLKIQEGKNDFWDIIQELQGKGWKIAQHGTYHKYVTNDEGILGLKKSSEFAGLSYEEQYLKLSAGKKLLEEKGIFTDIFMAPGHTFDKNTLKALEELGFRVVTDGLYSLPYFRGRIMFVPCRLQKLKNISGIDTVCLHSNLMTDAEIKELEFFCKKNRNLIKPFNADEIRTMAVRYNIWIPLWEKGVLYIRKIKHKIATSNRLTWYMQYTYDDNRIKKCVKRILALPLIVFVTKGRK